MGMAAFLIVEKDDEDGEWFQVVTDNIDSRHEVLIVPREKHTIGSLIHLFNIVGFYDTDVLPCTVFGTDMDVSVWRVDYDPDGSDMNAYRITVN